MENLNNEQVSPTIEKVSNKDLKSEKLKLNLETKSVVSDFVNAAMNLSDEELDWAIEFMKKKIDKLKG